MRYLDLFTGIDAPGCAWKALGWDPVAFAEIEPFPSAVLAHRSPEVPNLGDITKVPPDLWRALGAVDLLVAGAPCQAFSVAGLRKGLADPRGNLTLELLRVLDVVRPRWLVFENVPGLLTSTHHDAPDPSPPGNDVALGPDHEVVVPDEYEADEVHAFACFLAGLSELGYGWAYRVLDARYFGLAQRRERVFVVACLGDPRAAAAVLLERASLSGDPPASREEGAGPPGRAPLGAGGGVRAAPDDAGGPGRAVAPTLTRFGLDSRSPQAEEHQRMLAAVVGAMGEAGGHARPGDTPDGAAAGYLVPEQAAALLSPRDGSGGGYRADAETETLIPEGPMPFVKSRRAANADDDETWKPGEVAPTLNAFDQGDVRATAAIVEPVLYENHAQDSRIREVDVAPQINAKAGTGGNNLPLVAIPIQEPGSEREKRQNGLGVGADGEPMFTLQAGRGHAVAFDGYNQAVSEQSPTLGVNAGVSTGRNGVLEPRLFAVCLYDAKTSTWLHGRTDFGIDWWRDGNGSCDCNRLILLGLEDPRSRSCCGTKRVVAFGLDRNQPFLLNDGYDPELVDAAFLEAGAQDCPLCATGAGLAAEYAAFVRERAARAEDTGLVDFLAAREPVVFDAHATPGQPVSPTLTGGKSGGGRNDMNLPCVIQNTGQGFYREDDIAAPQRSHPGSSTYESTLIAFGSKGDGKDAGAIAPTMRAAPHDASHPNSGFPPAVAIQIWMQDATRKDCSTGVGTPGTGVGVDGDPAGTLTGDGPPAVGFSGGGPSFNANDHSSGAYAAAEASRAITGGRDRSRAAPVTPQPAMRVRRLTPVECERLQGFPDGWTEVPVLTLRHRKKCALRELVPGKTVVPAGFRPSCGCRVRFQPREDCPDGPRYRALGNSMAVPVMRWIGERIDILDAVLSEIRRDQEARP